MREEISLKLLSSDACLGTQSVLFGIRTESLETTKDLWETDLNSIGKLCVQSEGAPNSENQSVDSATSRECCTPYQLQDPSLGAKD